MIGPIASRSVVPGGRSPRPARGSRGGDRQAEEPVAVLGGVQAQRAARVGRGRAASRRRPGSLRATAPSASAGTASARGQRIQAVANSRPWTVGTVGHASGNVAARPGQCARSRLCDMNLTRTAQLLAFTAVAVSAIVLGAASEPRP